MATDSCRLLIGLVAEGRIPLLMRDVLDLAVCDVEFLRHPDAPVEPWIIVIIGVVDDFLNFSGVHQAALYAAVVLGVGKEAPEQVSVVILAPLGLHQGR